tara:strand:- start:9156 stop:9422 length:267 start_codon:yes stop_codon:yes gene_type:complete
MSDQNEISRDEHLINFIKSFAAIEECIEPFKEQRKDLRESYRDNNWLTTEDMRLAVKAYRLVQQDADMEQLTEYFNQLKRTMGRLTGV